MPCNDRSIRRNKPRGPDSIRAQRQVRRELRDTLRHHALLTRQVAAHACGANLVYDPTGPGDFHDNTGYHIDTRPTLRPPDQHAPHVQAFYDAVCGR